MTRNQTERKPRLPSVFAVGAMLIAVGAIGIPTAAADPIDEALGAGFSCGGWAPVVLDCNGSGYVSDAWMSFYVAAYPGFTGYIEASVATWAYSASVNCDVIMTIPGKPIASCTKESSGIIFQGDGISFGATLDILSAGYWRVGVYFSDEKPKDMDMGCLEIDSLQVRYCFSVMTPVDEGSPIEI